MADAHRRSALDGHLAAPAISGVSQVSLSERRAGAMAMVLGADDGEALRDALSAFRLTTTPSPGRCSAGEGVSVLWVGPGQYLIVSSRHHDGELESSLAIALAALGAVAVDLSHARTVLRLEGTAAVDVLAKGCPLDLEAMRVDDTAATVLGHFNIYLHRDDDGFDVYVFRSFGLACMEWLQSAGREYAIQVKAQQ